MLRSLEQERAKYAWECVNEVKEKSSEVKEKYKSYVKRSVSLILTNGLGNTLAFYGSKFKCKKNLSKDEEAYKLVYEHIDGWFRKRFKIDKDILEWIIYDASSLEVFNVTKEIISLLIWMRRFVEAELEEEGE